VSVFFLVPVHVGGWCRWALVSPNGVAPSRMVGVSASVNLPLHHKVQKFSSGTGSPGSSRKRAIKRLWWWWYQFMWIILDKGPLNGL